MNKMVSNYLFNLIYQVSIVLLPIITIPYISRTLGPDGVGINAYTLSFVQIFSLFSLLGIPLYGSKKISSVKHLGLKNVSLEFWSIFRIQIITSSLILLIYIGYVVLFLERNQNIFLCQGIALLAAAFDISWLFIGLEEIKKTVLRNLIVRSLSVFFIFVFVKDDGDLIVYIIINVVSNLIGNIILWGHLRKYVTYTPIRFSDFSSHIKPIIYIFLPQAIIQVYVVIDKLILGFFSNAAEVGYYDQGMKLVKLCLSIVTSLGIVMLPRVSAEFAQGNIEKVKYYGNYVLKFVIFLTLPMCLGLMAISIFMVPWFLGDGYEKVGILIIILSPIIILIGLSNMFGMQILLPTGQQSKLTISVSIGAISSIIINLLLVRYCDSIGTAVATLVAELSVTLVQYYFVRSYLNINNLSKAFLKSLISSVLMGCIIFIYGLLVDISSIILTFSQVIIGCILYFIFLKILKDEFLTDVIKSILNIKKRLR